MSSVHEYVGKIWEFSKAHPWVIAAGGVLGLYILLKSGGSGSSTGQPSWQDRTNARLAEKSLGFQHQENMASINGQTAAIKMGYNVQEQALGIGALMNIYNTRAQIQMQQDQSNQGILAWLLSMFFNANNDNSNAANRSYYHGGNNSSCGQPLAGCA